MATTSDGRYHDDDNDDDDDDADDEGGCGGDDVDDRDCACDWTVRRFRRYYIILAGSVGVTLSLHWRMCVRRRFSDDDDFSTRTRRRFSDDDNCVPSNYS